MLKVIGATIIILCGTGLGIAYVNSLSRSAEFLENFLKFITFTENEIRFSNDSLFTIISKFETKGLFKIFLRDCKNELISEKNFFDSWSTSLNKISKSVSLSSKAISLIENFGRELGRSNVETQVTHCKLYKSLVKDYISLIQETKKNKSKLYVTLGVCGSITLVLILI